MNSVEIKEKRNALKVRMQEIINTCKKEVREMSEEEKQEFDANKAEIEDLTKQLADLKAKLAEYEAAEQELKECGVDEEPEVKADEEQPTTEETQEQKNRNFNKMEKFSLMRSLNALANGSKLNPVDEAVVKRNGFTISMPTEFKEERATVTTSGGHTVGVKLENVLDPLRAKNVLVQAGAKFYTTSNMEIQVPVMNKNNVSWEGESGTSYDGAGSFSSCKLTPHRLTAYIDISKAFLAMDSVNAEASIRQDLVNAINNKLEATILGTSYGANQPDGLAYTATATKITAFSNVCNIEADLEKENYDEGKWIVSPSVKASLRGMVKGANAGAGMVFSDGEIDGTETFVTSNVASSYAFYGDWKNIGIAQFGNIDLTVDPYSQAANGNVRITINTFWDFKDLRGDKTSTRYSYI